MRRTIVALMTVGLLSSVGSAQTSWFETGQEADLMLSGIDFNNTGGPLLFNHPSGIASDGTHFLLCDRFNNRILVWNTLPDCWDAPPDLVLGQENFYTNAPGKTKAGLNFPGNVSVGANGIVSVCDTENDRILIWLQFPTRSGQPADVELRLPDFSPPGAPMRYEWPWGVWTDGTRLVASATHGGALLFWNSIPTRDNVPPDFVLSRPEFGTLRTIASDGQSYFLAGDHNARVGDGPDVAGTFVWNSFPSGPDDAPDFFLGSPCGGWLKGVQLPSGQFVAGALGCICLWDSVPRPGRDKPSLIVEFPFYGNGDGPDVVYAGGKLFVNNYNGNNVLVYESVPTRRDQAPDWALGSPSPYVNTLDSLHYIQNPVLATDGRVLIATSDFDRAVYIWKSIPQRSGQPYDVKIDLRRNGDVAPWDNALWGDRFVAAGQNKVAIWDHIPINGEPPSRVFTDRIGHVQFQEIRGVALDSTYLYVADRDFIAVWRGLPETGHEEPYAMLRFPQGGLNSLHSDGQYLSTVLMYGRPQALIFRLADIRTGETIDPTPCVRIESVPPIQLNLPSCCITFDGSVAVANTVNNQVLLWRRIDQAGDPKHVVVLGQRSLEDTEPGIGRDRLFWPASLCAHDNTLWVGEFKFSSRIVRFSYGASGTGEERGKQPLPRTYWLGPNYPNPFNDETVLTFALPAPGHAVLSVFDLRGREIARLLDGTLTAGIHRVRFWAQGLPTGLYVCQLRAGNRALRRKMLLLK